MHHIANSNEDLLPEDPLSTELREQTARMKVLIVDDSRSLRMVLRRELNAIGITNTDMAEDGTTAIEALRKEPFDLMLLDMEMPELTGIDVLRIVKADPELHHVPVIIVSG